MEQQESEYERWVRLANDPAQTEVIRLECRAKLNAYLKKRLRKEFEQLAHAALRKPAQ